MTEPIGRDAPRCGVLRQWSKTDVRAPELRAEHICIERPRSVHIRGSELVSIESVSSHGLVVTTPRPKPGPDLRWFWLVECSTLIYLRTNRGFIEPVGREGQLCRH